MGNVVSDTIAELHDGVDRQRALSRLCDWRDRVHDLYDNIEAGLGPGFSYDRTGKHRTQEGVVQGAGLTRDEIPPIDILRIEQPRGTVRAMVQPRHLWMIGANGRLDLVIFRRSGAGRGLFRLLDLSSPMSDRTDWRLISGTEPLDQPPFTIERFRQLLE